MISDTFGFRYEVPDVREPIAFHLVIDGMYEPDTLAFIMDRLPPGGVFVDVGANVGVFTFPATKRVGPRGRVLAAEASPDLFKYLLRNIAANNASEVTSFNCAISDSTGSVPFYPAPREKFGMGSLGAQFSGKPIGIRARTLDNVLEEAGIHHVDVLKVDVEGFEVSVFRGALKLLTGPRSPFVVFEFCDWAEARVPDGQIGDAQQFLLDHGYSIYLLRNFLHKRVQLQRPMKRGSAMLVAWRD